jgi:hypothetical protein
MEVKLNDKELVDWIVGRRDLDLITFGKRKSTSEAAAKADAEAKEKAAASTAKFADKQRDKAMQVVKERIAAPAKVKANT